MSRKDIRVDYLARVEGEGRLIVELDGERVRDARLEIFEPPRFFEAFLRGRAGSEAPDITARICGICPVAYQMSSVHAIEAASGVEVTPTIAALRRLLYCGEWIESHCLHIFMLHAPDFLGYESGVHMAKDHLELVRMGLAMKKAGNEIVRVVGGREIHPINVKLGGFYRFPHKQDLARLREQLLVGREGAEKTVRWAAGLDFPDFTRQYNYVALRGSDGYPFNLGRVVSTEGLDVPVTSFDEHFREQHVPHSNALQCLYSRSDSEPGKPYFVGPAARWALNADLLPNDVRNLASEVGLERNVTNPFRAILVRAVEVLFAFDEAVRLVDAFRPEGPPAVEVAPRSATGRAATEAPRGLLYHRYTLDRDGTIVEAKIVPPTSQNQRTIELDLTELVPRYFELPDEQLTWRCEQAVRNYDPCISCATHFLKLERRPWKPSSSA